MASDQVRLVNVVPNLRIKKERRDEEDDVVLCKLCAKGFASHTALINHAKVEHIQEYIAGEELGLEPPPKMTKAQQREETKKKIKRKTDELISSMTPTDLMSFASPEVSYIIIKAPEGEGSGDRPRKERARRGDKIMLRKERGPMPIAGPFECLQPSTLVADGTCHQIFFSCCEYSTHYRDEHTRRRKGTRCQVCEKPLKVEPAQPFSCDTCGAGYKTQSELAEHTSTAHIKLRPYPCSMCHKRFTQIGGLQQHMRMHTGDRPFNCTFCPKAFTQKSGLEQHLRIHTKVRPYRCVICSKSFCQSVHLKQHMRTHTNVSPFECALCQKRFKQSSHLNYHLKCHNPATMTDEQRAKYEKLAVQLGWKQEIEVELNPEHYEFVSRDDETMEESEVGYEAEDAMQQDVEEVYILEDYAEESEIV